MLNYYIYILILFLLNALNYIIKLIFKLNVYLIVKVTKMSFEQATSQTEVLEQSKSKKCNIKKEGKLMIVNDIHIHCQESDINIDTFNKWSDKSKDIPFKSSKKCVGNGEEKLAKESEYPSSTLNT